jgi:signal transduction histidine kinase
MPEQELREAVYRAGETIYDNNYSNSQHTQYIPEGHTSLKNVLIAPIKEDNQTIGLLGLGQKDGDFDENDAKIATSFAELVSISLINSRNLENLKKEKAKLRELNISKDKFFRIISHDLKNPLSAIEGFSQLGIKNIKNKNYDKVLEYYRIINEASKQNLLLINNVLTWSRLETGEMKYRPESIHLRSLVKEMLNQITANAYQKKIQVTIEIPDGMEIFADKYMLETILRNMTSNAIKYTQQDGFVKLIAKEKKHHLLFTVSDNGIGMTETELNRLFTLEKNQSKPGTEQEEGTGLGLMLCKEFIEKHGGEIWVKSTVNKGTKFSFTIPDKSED